ncbi:MAG: AMP-binding protein [Inhella sp.]|uniref:AMP-binding protein n=1 Tax=Inhella sp. TaxID=1921806 RepID=UPI0022C01A25|nr:AMP-binding protein [Inhella sp.]MCZ8234392.1 AMP-binding protein [Inhella sp.]
MSATAVPNALPLLTARDLQAPLAWRGGVPVSAARFLGQALALAEHLPAAGQPINLCQDRYLFALGLAAALIRRQTSLLPPNALPETMARLSAAGAEGQASAYAMVDDATLEVGGLQRVLVQPAETAAEAATVPDVPADFEAVCLLTSGSTGAPQPHLKRWGALVMNIVAEAERLAALSGQPSLAGLTLVGTVPPQHSYGLESTVLLALLGGACFEADRPFYPADIAESLAGVPAPRALVTTPFHLKTLLLAQLPLPPTALLLSATAPLSPQLAQAAETATGGTLVEIYGCTEAGQVATRRTTAGETWHALTGLRVWREEVEGGEQFCVHGGHVLEPTPLADLLALDDATHFRLLGRANDLIHVAGKRSSLAHLNFHLNRIDGVEDGAFWMPEERADGVARPVAFVVAPQRSDKDVIDALREHLEPAFVPRRVVHVSALPRTATGKLTAQDWARFARDALSQAGRYVVDSDHPTFAGHFPGQPVLPGVALLSLVMRTLDAAPELRARLGSVPQINNVKFISPVLPDTELRVELQPQGRGVGFAVLRGDGAVAKGLLTAGAAPEENA